MQVGNIVKGAIEQAWNNKKLWIFGFLSAFSYSFSSDSQNNFLNTFVDQWLEMICLGIGLTLLSTFFAYGNSRGSLRVIRKEEITLSMVFDDAKYFFTRGLVLTVIQILITAALFAVGSGLYAGISSIVQIPYWLAILIALPISYLFSIYFAISSMGLVVHDLSVADALRSAWENLASRLGAWIQFAIQLFGVTLAYLVAILIAGIVIGAIFFFLAFQFDIVGLILGVVLFVPYIVVITSVGTIAAQITWLTAYLELSEQGVQE